MRFKVNHTTEQEPNRLRNTEGAMYTEIKSDDPDVGGIECILDRTQEDVDAVKALTAKLLSGDYTSEEYAEFKKSMKGALNYSDLERIEYNLNLLKEMFAPYVTINYYSMDRDYIPRTTYFTNLLKNVKILRDTMYILATTPQVPALPVNKFKDWNDIEQIIYDVYWTLRRFERSFYYCGEIYANGNVLI